MKLIYSNLKMNFSKVELENYLNLMCDLGVFENEHDIKIATPFIYLDLAISVLNTKGITKPIIMAQDISNKEGGAFTSQISASQISSLGVKQTLIGHSECRLLNQTSQTISEKIKQSLQHGIGVVYCCGENPLKEIKDELSFLSTEQLKHIVIAYEPITAIGTGQAMNPKLASEQITHIKELLCALWPGEGGGIKLLYGGSVNEGNASDYLNSLHIDGVLIGGASLFPKKLNTIICG